MKQKSWGAMSESEWRACDDPGPMIQHLQRLPKRKPSDRKYRLFLTGLWRRFHATGDLTKCADPNHFENMANGLEAAEQIADGLLDDYQFQSCWLFTNPALQSAVQESLTHPSLPGVVSKETLVALLRDVVGNPFRPVSINPAWLAPTVTGLATVAYNERSLPSGELDTARLAVLADALEEAGCNSADILGHLRSAGPHVRGCWAVDLLLGKE